MKVVLISIMFTSFFPKSSPINDSVRELISGNGNKAWQLHASVGKTLCSSAEDDEWIFSHDGAFEYTHGLTTEDSVHSCSDLINITGKWELTDDTKLKITAISEKGNASNTLSSVIIDGQIKEIEATRMLITIANGTPLTLEFRAKQ